MLTATVMAVLLVGPASLPPVHAAQAVDSVTLQGRGYGHGHGLSQYGAEGAARQGLGWKKIVRFYYPKTSFAQQSGKVRVLVTADTSDDVVVRARSGLVGREVGKDARSWTLDRPDVNRWRIAPGAKNRLQFKADGVWKTKISSAKDLEFAAQGAPMRLVLPEGSASYRGVLRAVNGDSVNILGLEAYLRGVVPEEVPALWHPNAVRAQAVAARTYAAFLMQADEHPHYDLCDTAYCQVYGGADAEHEASDAAIAATKGVVVVKGGAPIFSQFSASNGGWSSAGSRSYLVAQPDPYDAWDGNPHTKWKVSVDASAIEGTWPSIGRLTGVKVTVRDGNGTWGGRAVTVKINGSKDSVSVSGERFRSALGLRSTWLRVV